MLPTDYKHKSKKRPKNGDNPNALYLYCRGFPFPITPETSSDMVMVTGLSTEIFDFCGLLPIYYTKRHTLEPTHDSNNGTASKRLDL